MACTRDLFKVHPASHLMAAGKVAATHGPEQDAVGKDKNWIFGQFDIISNLVLHHHEIKWAQIMLHIIVFERSPFE